MSLPRLISNNKSPMQTNLFNKNSILFLASCLDLSKNNLRATNGIGEVETAV